MNHWTNINIDPQLAFTWSLSSTFQNFWPREKWLRHQVQEFNQRLAPRSIRCEIIDICDTNQYADSILVTNNVLRASHLPQNLYQNFENSFYCLYQGICDLSDLDIKRDFNCFISRMDPFRQSWFYQLIRRNLLDKGYVSFRMDISRHATIARYANLDAIEIFEKQFQDFNSIFTQEHALAKNIVPYRSFAESDDLNKLIIQSKFSIILETYFESDCITFSEKTFRCLKLPRPWLLFSHSGAVAYLKELGFDTIDDVVDHGYDLEVQAVDRQKLILDQAEVLCDLRYSSGLISRLQRASDHNNKLLASWANTFEQDVVATLNKAESKLMAWCS